MPRRKVGAGTLVGRFLLQEEIGYGGFGQVYRALDTKDNDNPVAVKLSTESEGERSQSEETLEVEYCILQHINDKDYPGFPKVYDGGRFWNRAFIAMDLLGENLYRITRQQENERLRVQTVLILVDQLLTRFKDLHEAGYIHNDVKPDNMVMGRGKKSGQIYLVDFGLSETYRDSKGKHVENTQEYPVGTPHYMSVNVHEGRRSSRRDDLESLCYTLADLLYPESMTWLHYYNDEAVFMYRKKKQMTGKDLFPKGYIPPAFAEFYDKVRKLKFKEKPAYDKYKRMFRKYGKALSLSYKTDTLFRF